MNILFIVNGLLVILPEKEKRSDKENQCVILSGKTQMEQQGEISLDEKERKKKKKVQLAQYIQIHTYIWCKSVWSTFVNL